MARNGYASDFDLIDIPRYPGMRMQREAALQLAGACAEYWMEVGDKPGILEAFRDIATQKHYAATKKPGTFAPIVNGVGTSNHGIGLAVDMDRPLNSYRNWQWGVWDQIAQRWGFNNKQGKATGANGEPWHYVYVGNPQKRATGKEMEDMANLAQQVDWLVKKLGWVGDQADVEDRQLDDVQTKIGWMGDQADREDKQLDDVQQKQGWMADQADRVERKIDEALDKLGVKSAEVRGPVKPAEPSA